MKFTPAVWGPHYWFFLHTVAYTYPEMPNATIKKKMYQLIMDFPLWIPDEAVGNKFMRMLDRFPVTAYLDKRDSLIRWVHFIHNKINLELNKKEVPLMETLDEYISYYQFTKKRDKKAEQTYYLETLIYSILVLICIGLIYRWYAH